MMDMLTWFFFYLLPRKIDRRSQVMGTSCSCEGPSVAYPNPAMNRNASLRRQKKGPPSVKPLHAMRSDGMVDSQPVPLEVASLQYSEEAQTKRSPRSTPGADGFHRVRPPPQQERSPPQRADCSSNDNAQMLETTAELLAYAAELHAQGLVPAAVSNSIDNDSGLHAAGAPYWPSLSPRPSDDVGSRDDPQFQSSAGLMPRRRARSWYATSSSHSTTFQLPAASSHPRPPRLVQERRHSGNSRSSSHSVTAPSLVNSLTSPFGVVRLSSRPSDPFQALLSETSTPALPSLPSQRLGAEDSLEPNEHHVTSKVLLQEVEGPPQSDVEALDVTASKEFHCLVTPPPPLTHGDM